MAGVGGGGAYAAIAAAGDLRPIDTGMHSLPKVAVPALPPYEWTEMAVSSWIYEHASNAAGDKLLEILKDNRYNPAYLPRPAPACKRRVERRTCMMAGATAKHIRGH